MLENFNGDFFVLYCSPPKINSHAYRRQMRLKFQGSSIATNITLVPRAPRPPTGPPITHANAVPAVIPNIFFQVFFLLKIDDLFLACSIVSLLTFAPIPLRMFIIVQLEVSAQNLGLSDCNAYQISSLTNCRIGSG